LRPVAISAASGCDCPGSRGFTHGDRCGGRRATRAVVVKPGLIFWSCPVRGNKPPVVQLGEHAGSPAGSKVGIVEPGTKPVPPRFFIVRGGRDSGQPNPSLPPRRASSLMGRTPMLYMP